MTGADDRGADAAWDRAWSHAAEIPGWLTEPQARLLWDNATRLPRHATVVEIGSHKGRSTVVLASAVRRIGGTVMAVDPFVDGRLFGGKPTRQVFESNLALADVAESVRLVPEYSTKARHTWDAAIDLLYIDGKHDYWTFTDDLRWAVHLARDGRVLVHDAFSSIGVTLGILVKVLPSRGVVYEAREGSLAVFRLARPTRRDRLRVLAELPWWARNVAVKVLLRLRLRVLARVAFRHDSPYDPY